MRNGSSVVYDFGQALGVRARPAPFLKWHPATSDATTHRSSLALPATAGRQHEIFSKLMSRCEPL